MEPHTGTEKPRREGEAPLQTQNQIATGRVANHYGVERFGRFPLRVLDALEQGDLDLGELALICWLEGRANHSKEPPEVIATLARIQDALDWPWSDEALRQKMVHLKADGWIDYEVKAGSRKPYVIRLLACRVDGNMRPTSKRPPSDLQSGTPSELELTSNGEVLGEFGNPDAFTGSTSKQAPSSPSPRADSR
jgi:hypothetical protein